MRACHYNVSAMYRCGWITTSLLAIVLMTAMTGPWCLAKDTEILVGREKRRIETQSYRGQELFRLADLADIFSLQFRERGSSLTIVGARGEILITDGRPLVRSGDHYVLLSSGVWRRREGDWYVPEDFLLNALSNIVSQNLERQRDGSIQVRPLRINEVRVEMNSYPDHLSVIFEVSQKAPVQVREFRDYVEVVFKDFLVRPEQVAPTPDTRLITAVEFDEQESLGSFRIQKGSQFSSYRQHYLESPPQLIIEVYGVTSVQTAESLAALDPTHGGPIGRESEPGPSVRSGVIRDVVIIDPGHGGVDYGVDAFQDLSEKVITLNLARLIERQLIRRGVEVRLTRARDVQLPNEQRSAISNFYQCRLYLGIHLGGALDGSTRGPVVYIYSPPAAPSTRNGKGELLHWDTGQLGFIPASRQLANFVQSELNQLFASENPVVAARLAVLAPVEAPAVIVEPGFLTSTADQALLAAPGFQERIAESIANAITQYLR